jgi:hypothetical protein
VVGWQAGRGQDKHKTQMLEVTALAGSEAVAQGGAGVHSSRQTEMQPQGRRQQRSGHSHKR